MNYFKMNLDFLEIGTSNFNTEIQKATDETVGISVEPLLHFLKELPNPKKVIKENVAISFDDSEGEIDIYHIPASIIEKHNLYKDLIGCNSINTYHPQHKQRNLQQYVQIDKVKQIPISSLLEKYNVHQIDYLKIDTEGGDCYILLNLKKYLQNKDKTYYPKTIKFETNKLSSKTLISKTISKYTALGYTVTEITSNDTTMKLKRD